MEKVSLSTGPFFTVSGKKYKCTITVKSSNTSSSTTTTTPTYVWLSATGTKYHKISNCGRMNPANARKVLLSSLANNYSACSNCF